MNLTFLRHKLLRNKWFWITLVVILLAWWFFGTKKMPSKDEMPVSVATAKLGTITPHFDTVGTIDAINKTDIKSQVTGQLLAINVKGGDEVTQNQILFTINPSSFQAQVDQATATLKKDQANADLAQNELKRYKKLLKPGYISKDFYDQVEGKAASAKAQVEADQAALNTAKIQLGYTQIKAPIAGRVGDIDPDVGDLIQANSANNLTTIVQFKPIDVNFSLPGKFLLTILAAQKSQPLQVIATSTDDPSLTEKGTLTFINNQIDDNTGSVLMKGEFANDDAKLWPGQFVNVRVQTAPVPNAVLVPTIAIQQNQQQQNFVYVVDKEHKVHQRLVTIGISDAETTNILSGLKAGEVVVTRGQFRIADGMKVEIV